MAAAASATTRCALKHRTAPAPTTQTLPRRRTAQRPRMQQYLFTSPNPDRDSSMDGDVVFHEYGHGISNRLIGNGSTALSGTQSGAMGEGWSDYWAITINNDGAVGEYSTGNPNGIRRAAYTVPAQHRSRFLRGRLRGWLPGPPRRRNLGRNALGSAHHTWRDDLRQHRAQRDEVHA